MNRVQKCFLHLQQLPSANIIWNGNTNRSKKILQNYASQMHTTNITKYIFKIYKQTQQQAI